MITAEPHSSNTCIVIVTYHPQPYIKERIDELSQKFDSIIVVDNNSSTDEHEYLKNEKIVLIKNNTNLGIAQALNQGFEKAEELGYIWVITMDQDSRLMPQAMEVFLNIYHSYPNKNQLAMIAGNFFIDEGIPTYPCSTNGMLYSQTDTAITSGCLTNVSVWKEIGGFDNNFFIDNVDDEFCLRASLYNYKTITTNQIILDHQIGEMKIWYYNRIFKFIAPKKISPDFYLSKSQRIFHKLNFFRYKLRTYGPFRLPYNEHSPTRWYYQGRNMFTLYSKYRKTNKTWCKEALRIHRRRFIIMMIVEKSRFRKAAMYFKGIFHGIIKRTGPI